MELPAESSESPLSEVWGQCPLPEAEIILYFRIANKLQICPFWLSCKQLRYSQIGFTFLVPAHPGSPGQGPLNGCLCVLLTYLLGVFFGGLKAVDAAGAEDVCGRLHDP